MTDAGWGQAGVSSWWLLLYLPRAVSVCIPDPAQYKKLSAAQLQQHAVQRRQPLLPPPQALPVAMHAGSNDSVSYRLLTPCSKVFILL